MGIIKRGSYYITHHNISNSILWKYCRIGIYRATKISRKADFSDCTLFCERASSTAPPIESNNNKKNVEICRPSRGHNLAQVSSIYGQVNMWIIIWYLGDLFISFQCIHIIMILWSYCMCLSSFSLGSATSENHVMPVCYRLLASCKLNLQTRIFANIQFATGSISLSFHHVYYSKIIDIHICVYRKLINCFYRNSRLHLHCTVTAAILLLVRDLYSA